VAEWLTAEAHGEARLAAVFERRFLPEFRPAFDAWKKTDPLNNPHAPAGPQSMPQYRSAMTEQAVKLNSEATRAFAHGDRARQYSDEFVRGTVGLATVLLLVALSQRLRTRTARIGLLAVAGLLLSVSIYHILTIPSA